MQNPVFYNQNGVSTKELLITLVVMGFLCVCAILPYRLLQKERGKNIMHKVVQMVELKLKIHKNETDMLPQTLDDNPFQAVCESCFLGVLNQKIKQEYWYKKSPTTYLFYSAEFNTNPLVDADFTIEYNPKIGQFQVQKGGF